jgi:peptidoglycan-N-acetylglucosamine deacetylase
MREVWRRLGVVAGVLMWAPALVARPEPSVDAPEVRARHALFPEVRPLITGPRPELPEWAQVTLPPREGLPAVPIYHGGREKKRVALTFDACSTNDDVRYDPRITEILLATGTPATIFMGGKWMVDEPDRVRELAGYTQFELGLHGYAHPFLTRYSDERVQDELVSAERVLYALTGRRAEYYRPPFGDVDDRVVAAAAAAGYATVMYDAPSGDPDERATAPRIVDWLDTIVQGGSIIVMHINHRGRHTADALEEVIASLRSRGFVLVTLSDLLHPDEPSAPIVYAPDAVHLDGEVTAQP